MNYFEVNFDGLVGPNHNYAGLAEGNLASATNSKNTSYPKKAALQGLEKMYTLSKMGLKQAVIPPQLRPNLKVLKHFGFRGNERKLLDKATSQAPHLLAAVYSASSMWTANCATVSPSLDSEDGKVHFTPANLVSNFHRSIEGENSFRFLKKVFDKKKHFSVYPHLPLTDEFSDEGAANHIRFSTAHSESGLQLFVYGKGKGLKLSSRFKPRQDISASKALIRAHCLSENNTVLAMQSLKAIDAGVFHNDVISTGNEELFILHQHTFENQPKVLAELKRKFKKLCGKELHIEEISEKTLSLKNAIGSYIFNTQIVTLPDNSMTMIAPLECKETPQAKAAIEKIIAGPSRLDNVVYMDLRESMQNGGGPACLRLRVILSEKELEAMHQGVLLTEKLYKKLVKWVNKHYREELRPEDLQDYQLVNEIRTALDELQSILVLKNLYKI